MKSKRRRIKEWLFFDTINFNIRLPRVLLIYLVGIPTFAYFDAVFIGKTNFIGYVFICSIEWLLVWIGYSIGFNQNNTKKGVKK